MKKLLITGGSGFIGTNLISYLVEQHQYQILNIDATPPKIADHRVYWQQTDICDLDSLEKIIFDFNPNFVIHLAARTDLNGKDLSAYHANTKGVENLQTVLEKLPALERVIFTSSMYVCEPGYIPKDFEDYHPHTFYGESKVVTERLIKNSNPDYTWTIIRPTSIWGPWFGIPYADFFYIVMSGKYFHMGEKACTKTYGYIDNTIRQIMSLFQAPKELVHRKTFYLGDWPGYNISEWAEEIAAYIQIKIPRIPFALFRIAGWVGDLLKMIGIKFPMTSFRLKNMTTDNVHNLEPIQAICPDLVTSRKEGVEKTVDWIKSQKSK